MLDVKLNEAKLDTKLNNTAKTLSDTHSQNLVETQGSHDMNTNTYGAVTLLPSLFFILGVMLIMSVVH